MKYHVGTWKVLFCQVPIRCFLCWFDTYLPLPARLAFRLMFTSTCLPSTYPPSCLVRDQGKCTPGPRPGN